jgi:hypothetical protein
MPLRTSLYLLAILLALAVLFVFQFPSRFTQENYNCAATNAPFNRIVFSEVSEGEAGLVEGANPDTVIITSATDMRIDTDWGRSRVQLERKTGQVIVTHNRVVSSYACTQAEFQM